MPQLKYLLHAVAVVWITSLLIATSATAGSASILIQKMTNEAELFLNNRTISSDVRTKKLRDILRDAFNQQTMAQSIMGRYWRKASKAQRSILAPLLIDYIINSYAGQIDPVDGEIFFTVKGERQLSNRTMVDTYVVRPPSMPVSITWQIESMNDQPAVTDVIVEGISLIINQRADFASVIRQHGGIDGLIRLLHKRVGKANDPDS